MINCDLPVDPRLLCSSSQTLASISVDCDSNFNVDEVTCSFDGATPEPCKLIYVLVIVDNFTTSQNVYRLDLGTDINFVTSHP